MTLARTVGFSLVVAGALTGCSDDESGVEILAESATGPGDGTEPRAAWATTDAELAATWQRFGLSGSPSVSLADGPVLFVGTVESSSCPVTIESVGRRSEAVGVDADVFVEVGAEGGPECTADARAVSFVVRAPDVAPVRSVFVAYGNVASPLSGLVPLDQ